MRTHDGEVIDSDTLQDCTGVVTKQSGSLTPTETMSILLQLLLHYATVCMV